MDSTDVIVQSLIALAKFEVRLSFTVSVNLFFSQRTVFFLPMPVEVVIFSAVVFFSRQNLMPSLFAMWFTHSSLVTAASAYGLALSFMAVTAWKALLSSSLTNLTYQKHLSLERCHMLSPNSISIAPDLPLKLLWQHFTRRSCSSVEMFLFLA